MSYLARLKKNSEKHHVSNQQNQQNHPERGFAGFAGSVNGTFEKSQRPLQEGGTAPAWLLHYTDRDPMEVWTSPPCTHADALALDPDAVAAEPIQHNPAMRAASTSERNELLALIAAVYADDSDQDRQEATALALADPEGALTCYRAIAAERGLTVAKAAAPMLVSTSATATPMCRTCRHRATPGRVDPGYCAQRDDLPLAYGRDHPLHRLPADGGTDCPKWLAFE